LIILRLRCFACTEIVLYGSEAQNSKISSWHIKERVRAPAVWHWQIPGARRLAPFVFKLTVFKT
jgi:hypothetical protein